MIGATSLMNRCVAAVCSGVKVNVGIALVLA